MIAVGRGGAEQPAGGARALFAAVVGGLGDRLGRPRRRHTASEASIRMRVCAQVGHAADPGDPPVAEGHQVLHRLHYRGRVVVPDVGQRADALGSADHHRRQPHLLQHRHPGVVQAQVADEDAVDPPLAPPPPVERDLGLRVGDHLEHQRVRAGRQLRLDPADQLHEERFDAEGARRAAQRQAERVRAQRRRAPGPRCWGSSRSPRRSRSIRRRVASETPGWPFSAYETAPLETPARRAISAIVGRFTQPS